MPKPRRPTLIDIQTMLVQRRDMCGEKIAEYSQSGELGHEVYWRTIEADALMLLSWVSADEYWMYQAQDKKGRLERAIKELDQSHSTTALPAAKHNGRGSVCGSGSDADCDACQRDMALAIAHHG
jgi:hypothetical protein